MDAECIAVFDELGTVFERMRALPFPVALWRVREPRPLPRSAPIRFIVYAAYGPIDWRVIGDLALRTPTVIVATSNGRDEAAEALAHRVLGYLDLRLPQQTLDRALCGALLKGESGFSRAVLGAFMRKRRVSTEPPKPELALLTPRQREILALIATGATDKEIATQLGIAQATAEKHVNGILRRLGVPNRAAAVAYAQPLQGRHI